MTEVFHIGYHKTATTTLQRAVLPHVAGAACVTGDGAIGDAVIAHVASAGDDAYRRGTVAAFLADLRAAHGDEALIVSDENLSGTLWDDPVRAGRRTAERIAEIAEDPCVLVVVRRQTDLLRSIHAQYVNEGGTGDLADFLAGRVRRPLDLGHLCFDRLISRYDELVGPDAVVVVPYEDLRADLDLALKRLLAPAGLHVPALPAQRHNLSLGPVALAVLRRYNRLFRRTDHNPDPVIAGLPGGGEVRRLLQSATRRSPDTRVDVAALLPDRWQERYAESNTALDARLAGGLAGLGYPGLD